MGSSRARKKSMHELAGGGDDGSTGLLGGGRAPKDDPRIEAYGTVDEASSALGLAKALSSDARVREISEELQRGLYQVGAELATNPESGHTFARAGSEEVTRLDQLLIELESAVTMPDGFILPGSTPASAAFDLARTVIRRAERRCISLASAGGPDNPQLRRYLNRLSLVVFVLGRFEEARAGTLAKPARQTSRRR